jgi:hypothetical protein
VDWTTSKSNHSIQQMLFESSSLNSVSRLAMTVGLNITYISWNVILQGYFHMCPVQAHLDFEPVRLADSKGRRIYCNMNTSDWWCDTQAQLPARATIVPVISASDKTHLTNFLGDQHARPLYLTIGNIQKDIRRTPKKRAWILFGLIS